MLISKKPLGTPNGFFCVQNDITYSTNAHFCFN
jgi:hypothetical protein